MEEPQMTAPEPLCDPEMIKADYRLVSHKDGKPEYCFRIKVIPNSPTDKKCNLMSLKGEENYAAELEALAAIIRSRVIRAKLIGDEPN
jgi:hypothetical protein